MEFNVKEEAAMLWSNRILNLTIPVVLCMGLILTHQRAEADVARVTQLSGSATITRGTDTIAAAQGLRLHNEDIVITDAVGSIGIVFNDETTLSLGPDSKLIIQEYVFDPEHSGFSFVVRLLKGSAAYVSGLISRLSPDSTRFITPAASIGVRGTRFAIEVDPL
jgi:hypothetical protein